MHGTTPPASSQETAAQGAMLSHRRPKRRADAFGSIPGAPTGKGAGDGAFFAVLQSVCKVGLIAAAPGRFVTRRRTTWSEPPGDRNAIQHDLYPARVLDERQGDRGRAVDARPRHRPRPATLWEKQEGPARAEPSCCPPQRGRPGEKDPPDDD